MGRMGSAAIAALAMTQAGCIVLGYRSGGGWFMWPGGIGLIIMLALFLMMFFRRGRF
jgi:hypothetical protein